MGSRIALCHDWVMVPGGSEQVAGHLASALDVDDIYSYAATPLILERYFGDRDVRTSRVGASKIAVGRWPWLLPLMASWWRGLDLSAYDAVVTSSHSTVNAVRTGDDTAHISYCHTPMRYAWTWEAELGRLPPPLRPLWPAVASRLRVHDRRRSRNVDLFIANSRNVAGRIQRFYGRRALILYPPVETTYFTPDDDVARGDAFLYAGRLVAYKRVDVAIEAAKEAGVRLIVAGSGPELERLRRLATGAAVTFISDPSDEELRDLYRRSRALVFPGDEDFGITPVEAQACGTPVIAAARGGVVESVIDGKTGDLLADASIGAFARALRSFDPHRFDREAIVRNASRFSAHRFDVQIRRIVTQVVEARGADRRRAIASLLEEQRPQ